MKILSIPFRNIAILLAWCVFAASLNAANPIIRVALYDDAGAFGKGVPRITEQLGKVKDVKLTIVKGSEIAGGILKDFDVVIFSGGSGSKQSAGIGEQGVAEVQKFVKGGGGYIGICGGAYLACSGFSWGLGVLNAKTVSSKWKRGEGQVQIEVTQEGAKTTSIPAKQQEIRYANGPIIKPDERGDLPAYEPLAFFRSELAENGSPAGAMVNSPAWVRATCGKGRVITSSPHPEQTAGMENFVEHAVRWVAGKN
jgi:putative intracellular protease/amidase